MSLSEEDGSGDSGSSAGLIVGLGAAVHVAAAVIIVNQKKEKEVKENRRQRNERRNRLMKNPICAPSALGRADYPRVISVRYFMIIFSILISMHSFFNSINSFF